MEPTLQIVNVTLDNPSTTRPDYSAGRGALNPDEQIAFERHLRAQFDMYGLNTLNNAAGRERLTALIRYEFDRLHAADRCIVIFDGLRLTRGFVVPGRNDWSVNVAYDTAFYPRPRFEQPHSLGLVALGFYQVFDLYKVDQGDLPATLIARYGDRPEMYLSANPYLLSAQQLAGMEWAAEALIRAQHVGAL